MNIYFLMHDALFHLQRGSSLDILPRENISRRLWHLLGHQALPWNMALIMMGNMAYGLERDGAKSEEHDHETLEIFIEVPWGIMSLPSYILFLPPLSQWPLRFPPKSP